MLVNIVTVYILQSYCETITRYVNIYEVCNISVKHYVCGDLEETMEGLQNSPPGSRKA